MGYSIGFLRGVLTLVTLSAGVGLLLGGANELLGLGLFEGGYPGVAARRGAGSEGVGFDAFALQMGIVIAVSVAGNLLLERLDR